MPNTNYSPAEKKFIDRHVAPTGYADWNVFAKGMVRSARGFSKELPWFENYQTAPAYFITVELYESLIITDFKLVSEPNIVNHQFYVFTSRCKSTVDFTHIVVNNQSDLFSEKYGRKDVYVSFNRSRAHGKPNTKITADFAFSWQDLMDYKNATFTSNLDEIKDHQCCKECTEKSFNDQAHLIVNLILLMNVQPEIVTESSISIPTKAKGFKTSTKELPTRTISWVGKDFTRRVIRKTTSTTQGSNSPKSSHWRRGHWHTVSQGPGRKQKRLKWFQPAFIVGNAGDSSTKNPLSNHT